MGPTIFGHTLCSECAAPVLDEVARVTGRRCGPCFRADVGGVLRDAVAVGSGGERFRLRVYSSSRPPGERRRRVDARSRARKRSSNRERARLVATAERRAKQRLRNIFPALYEVILADERASLGLDDFTIDKAVAMEDPARSIDFVATYARLGRDIAS